MSRAMSNPLDVLEQLIDGEKNGPVPLQYSVLCEITEDFSPERIIGSGAHGYVYRGEVRYKPAVAVKKLIGGKDDNFKDEAMNMMNIPQHTNVVRFLGYCFYAHQEIINNQIYDRIQRFLCFEYISKGSLDKYIKDGLRGLEWHKRFRIIKGICEGVQHLHANGLVHMDLKPQNILLDEKMMPKIADFGISMFTENLTTTTSFRGTPGYCDPAPPINGGRVQYSFHSDIYSVGIIITEVVTGIKKEPEIMDVLKTWKHRWSKSKDDTRLRYQQVKRCLELAKECKRKWQNRPKIDDILRRLREVDNDDDDEFSSSAAEEEYPIEKVISGLKDMLGIHPLELHFPFEDDKDMKSSTVELRNKTDEYMAFRVSCTADLDDDGEVGVIRPGAKHSVTVTLKAKPGDHNRVYEETPPCVTVESTQVSKEESDLLLGDKDAIERMFSDAEDSGRELDEVTLDVFFDKPNEMTTPAPTDQEPKPFSKQLLLVHPTELRFPLLHERKEQRVAVPLQLTNETDKEVAFMFTTHSRVMDYASSVHGDKGILAPGSKWGLLLSMSMEAREGTPIIDDLIKDKLMIRSAPLDDLKDKGLEIEDINEQFFDQRPDAHDLELEVVFVRQDSDELHSTTTAAAMGLAGSATTLMGFDAIGMEGLLEVSPLQLRFPFEPSKPISCIINLINRTSEEVYYCIFIPKNRERYDFITEEGTLDWGSTNGKKSWVGPHSTLSVMLTMIGRMHKPSNMMDEIRIYMSNQFVNQSSGIRNSGIVRISLMTTLCEPYIPKHEDIDIDGHQFGDVKAMDVHPTKPMVLTYHSNDYLCIWMTYEQHEGSSTKLLYNNKCEYRNNLHPKFLPRTQWIVAFHIYSPDIYKYNDKLEEANNFEAHNGRSIGLAAVHPTDSYFLTAPTHSGEIKLWKFDKDTADCHSIRVFKEQRLCHQLIFDPRGSNTFATVSKGRRYNDRIIKIRSMIDSDSPTSQFSFEVKENIDLYCSTESELQYIGVSCLFTEAKIFEIDHPQKSDIHTVEDGIQMPTGGASALHPTLPFLVRCGNHGISIWNYKTDRLMQVLEPWEFSDTHEYAGFMEVEGNKRLVVGSNQGIKILDINWASLSG